MNRPAAHRPPEGRRLARQLQVRAPPPRRSSLPLQAPLPARRQARGGTRLSPSASAAITTCSAAWSGRGERPPDCDEAAQRAPATRIVAATVAAVAWTARSAVFAATVAEEGGRFGGDGKGRRGGVASAFGRARPEAAVFGAAFVSECTAGLALCPLRSGRSTWLLPARGFFTSHQSIRQLSRGLDKTTSSKLQVLKFC